MESPKYHKFNRGNLNVKCSGQRHRSGRHQNRRNFKRRHDPTSSKCGSRRNSYARRKFASARGAWASVRYKRRSRYSLGEVKLGQIVWRVIFFQDLAAEFVRLSCGRDVFNLDLATLPSSSFGVIPPSLSALK
jgi:hypothetical protein